MQIERAVAHQPLGGQAADRERDRPLRAGSLMLLLVERRDVAPDHHRDEARRIKLGAIQRADIAAVAQHADPVGELIHLLHAVADVDDGDALRLEPGDHLEQAIRLARGQRRRRLVHDDDARIGG